MAAQDRQIKNEVDLQNLVTMIILKKKGDTNGFSDESLAKEIKDGEAFKGFCSENELIKLISDTMQNFIRNGYFYISIEDYKYYPTNS